MADTTPTAVTQYQTGFSPEIAPYGQAMLGQAAALTNVNTNPYMQYQGERIAQFTPLQKQSYQNAALMQTAPQLKDATAMAGLAGLGALNTGYTYNPFQAAQVNAQKLTNYQMTGPANVAAQNVNAGTINAAQTAYNPSLQNYQMQGPNDVKTQSFTSPGVAKSYMNPFLDAQNNAAYRNAAIANAASNAQATTAGAFGGGRQALMGAQNNADLQRTLGQNQFNAYNQAQGQFNTEQGANLQAQLANQNMGYNVGSQNLQANLGVQQLGTSTGLQTALANLTNQQQANVQNEANKLQASGMNAQNALQAALANQNMGYNVGNANLQANLGVQQLGSSQNLQAQLANQSANQAAANLNAQQGQFGSNLGMQGLNTALQSANTLGQLGTNQYNQNLGIIGLQNQLGGQQQQQVQNDLNNKQQDFLNYQNYPYQQLNFMSNLVRGLPMTQQSASVYQAPPSMASQVAGLGLTAAGLGAFKGASGGSTADIQSHGIQDLALAQMGA
jgi:hypothetical protein